MEHFARYLRIKSKEMMLNKKLTFSIFIMAFTDMIYLQQRANKYSS